MDQDKSTDPVKACECMIEELEKPAPKGAAPAGGLGDGTILNIVKELALAFLKAWLASNKK